MNELFPNASEIGRWALWAIVIGVGWYLKRHLADYDDFKKSAVTRKEMERMHQENGDKLDGIEETVNQTHRRIDDLFKFLAGR